MEELKEKLALLTENALQKIIISKPVDKASEIRKIVVEQKKAYYQAARYTEKQVFHDNVEKEALATYLYEKMIHDFLQLNAFDEEKEYMLMLSKKGK